ncbi:MAG TPA: cyanophycin synthetase, partial [Acidobacteriaceae bacterium]
VMFTVEAQGQRATVQLQLMGRHNVHNALAAIAVGLRSGMPLEQCAAALAGLRAGDKRGEIREWRGAKVINDCYNSNPRALGAMVDALLAIPVEGRHIVVAGEMLELGPEGEALHCACGGRMAERGVDVVVGVRGLAEALVRGVEEAGGRAIFVASPEEAGAWVKANVAPGDAVLFKASRGVRLERALTVLDEA